jgi:hypothetical protein
MVQRAFQVRERPLGRIQSVSIEHTVEHIGSTFAAVIFGY